jgi:hypothetical protein
MIRKCSTYTTNYSSEMPPLPPFPAQEGGKGGISLLLFVECVVHYLKIAPKLKFSCGPSWRENVPIDGTGA